MYLKPFRCKNITPSAIFEMVSGDIVIFTLWLGQVLTKKSKSTLLNDDDRLAFCIAMSPSKLNPKLNLSLFFSNQAFILAVSNVPLVGAKSIIFLSVIGVVQSHSAHSLISGNSNKGSPPIN